MADCLCALCGDEIGETSLVFLHEHREPHEMVSLNIRLCLSCGNRIEKHLKRAVPKRLMDFRTLA